MLYIKIDFVCFFRRREEFVDAILCGLRAVVAIKSLRIEKLVNKNNILLSLELKTPTTYRLS